MSAPINLNYSIYYHILKLLAVNDEALYSFSGIFYNLSMYNDPKKKVKAIVSEYFQEYPSTFNFLSIVENISLLNKVVELQTCFELMCELFRCDSEDVGTFISNFKTKLYPEFIQNIIDDLRLRARENINIRNRWLSIKAREEQLRSEYESIMKELDFWIEANTIVEGECTICINELGRSFNLVKCTTQCNQYFHKKCMDQWLTYKDSCPLCVAEWLNST